MRTVGEKITLKKPHACGAKTWQVVRTGVDVKLRCDGCGRYLNLTHDEVRRLAIQEKDDKE